ncbi:MAG TPA: FUSC family protein [Hyphomicrobium sp.]|nr:FUSC family protein [Hyphomicrobium sp.]
MRELPPIEGMAASAWPRVRQAIQTTIAACASYVAADAVGLSQGFWAVMTAILVTQANVGASLGLAIERLMGSLLGVVVGGVVAIALADAHEWRFAGLAVTVLVLAFFAARRPALRIACVTAAIVVLGDPSLGPPITSAETRMLGIVIGTVVAIATMLIVFPSRAGIAFAEHVKSTLIPLIDLLGGILAGAAGKTGDGAGGRQPVDAERAAEYGAKIRSALATGNKLAGDARLEVTGYVGDSPDPESMLRALRRLWHTEIMLLRATAQPLPARAIERLGPAIAELQDAVDQLGKNLAASPSPYATADLSAVETALAKIVQGMEDMRAKGEMREMPMDDVIRLLAFDFALGQLRLNLRELAEREAELAAFAGSTFPLLRRIKGLIAQRGLKRATP